MTAHHEAAHAVVALILGWSVRHIVMDSDQEGVTCADPADEEKDDAPAHWRENCTIRVAGAEGERRLLASPDYSTLQIWGERQEALDLARRHVGARAQEAVAACEARAREMVANRWDVIVDVASRLSDESVGLFTPR